MDLRRKILKCNYKCSICGKKVFNYNMTRSEHVTKVMLKEHICWECAFWQYIIKNPLDNMEIIDNNYYQIFPYVSKEQKTLGIWLGGNKTQYLLKKNGTCYRSNDIWNIGAIPLRFQNKLQSTAWFTNEHTWKSLTRSKHICKSKYCLDRFHCYRYDYKSEYDESGIAIPNNWEVGAEHCPAFIPTRDIKNFDKYL